MTIGKKQKRMPQTLVTGASGFVGQAICQHLQEGGIPVRALMRHKAEGPWNEMVLGDIAAPLPCETLHNVDTIFHLAGKAHALSETQQDADEYFNINTEGTRNLLEAAQQAGVRRFVFFSSVKAMGEGGKIHLNEADPCVPKTPYGRSKLEAEWLVLHGEYVPEPVVLRLSMVYGLTTKGNLPRMVQAINKGVFPPLPEVDNKRSMVHVDDVATLALAAATQPMAVGATYIITDGQTYTTREMYEWICDALHKPRPKWVIPMTALKLLAKLGDMIGQLRGRRFMFDSDVLAKLIGSAWYSSEKVQRELGIEVQHRLQDSLPEIITYLNAKSNKNI